VERALILNKGKPLVFHDLHVSLKPEFHFKQGLESESHPNLQDKDSLALDAIMSGHIHRVLEMTGGKIEGKGGAAELLQMNPSTLRKRMRKLGIPFGRKTKQK
jgi:transcriptional regulator with GAF, ATPase, and Fis domain